MVGAVLVGTLTSSMTQLRILHNEKAAKLSKLRKYLRDNAISYRLTLRVTRNAQHAIQEQENYIPEAHVELLELVSEPLRIELHFELYAKILKEHPFFEEMTLLCPHIMQKVCHTSTSIVTVATGDIIFNLGEIPPKPKMIFVATGSLSYNVPNPASLSSTRNGNAKTRRTVSRLTVKHEFLAHGEWIAEPVLWTHWMHRGILTATNDCRLCLIDASKFMDAVSAFDHDEFNPKVYAAGFVAAINSTTTSGLDDCTRGLETIALEKLQAYMEKMSEAKLKAGTGSR